MPLEFRGDVLDLSFFFKCLIPLTGNRTKDVYKTWTGVHGPPLILNKKSPLLNSVSMKIYQRSGYRGQTLDRLVFIAYVLDGLTRNSGLAPALRRVVQQSLATVHSLQYRRSLDRFKAAAIVDEGTRRGWSELCYPATFPLQVHVSFNTKTKYTLCSPILELQAGMKIMGGRNALDLLYRKTRWWSSHLWGAIPKQPAITRQTRE